MEPNADHASPRRSAGAAASSSTPLLVALGIGALVGALPFLWALGDLWSGTVDLTRSDSPSNIYSVQARALLHGRLTVPSGSIGIEGFVHDHRTYTYFGLLLSILRMPILAIAPATNANSLTVVSMGLGWLLGAVAVGALYLRLRRRLIGTEPVHRLELLLAGCLSATTLGGSVLVALAATPDTYDEDILWSAVLLLVVVWCLLGVEESPTLRRIALASIAIMATALTRPTVGLAAVVGGMVVAVVCMRRKSTDARRGGILLGCAALGGLLLAMAINVAKFGTLTSVPLGDQVWTALSPARRRFLASHDGQPYDLNVLPTTIAAYLAPFGIRLSSTFPYAFLPAGPPVASGGVLFDGLQPTASVPASMPLLTLLGVVGIVATLRRGSAWLRVVAVPLLVTAVPVAGILIYGYITERYLGDFLPLLVVTSILGTIGLVALANRHGRGLRTAIGGIVAVLCVASLALNAALASTPGEQWSTTQLRRFVTAQRRLSITPPHPIAVDALPSWAPAGTLFDVRQCNGLYLSNGNRYDDLLGERLMHTGMLPIEQAAGIATTMSLRLAEPVADFAHPVVLATVGSARLELRRAGAGIAFLELANPVHPGIVWPATRGGFRPLRVGVTYHLRVVADPNLTSIRVFWLGASTEGTGTQVLARPTDGSLAHIVVHTSTSPVATAIVPTRPPSMALCRSMAAASR